MSPPLPVDVAQLEEWQAEFDHLHERLRPYAAQGRTHDRMKLHLEGVLGKAERKNGWHLAEAAGDQSPYAMQHLLGRASWDVVGVREEARRYVREGLGSAIRARIVDESGFLKKGEKSGRAPVQRNGGTGGELPGWGVPGVRDGIGVCLRGRGTVPAGELDEGPGALP